MPSYPAQARYKAKNIKHCGFDLNKKTESDLIAYLETKPNRAKYLKDLIRQDMERESRTNNTK